MTPSPSRRELLALGGASLVLAPFAAAPAQAAASPSSLPGAKRTRSVKNGAELASALNTALPGDHIVLRDGTYTAGSSFRCGRSGTTGAPIVIRAATLLRAHLRKGMVCGGSNVIIWGLDFIDSTVELGGSNDRLTRCKFLGAAKACCVSITGGTNVRVDHCDITTRGLGIRVKLRNGPNGNPTKPIIDHNWIHDFTGRRGENGHEGIQIGQATYSSGFSCKATVEYNLLENVEIDNEAISIKCSDNTVRNNTILGCDADLSIRHGNRNKVIGNWVERSYGITVFDEDTLVQGNKIISCSGNRLGLRVMGGDCSPTSPKQNHYPYAARTKLVDNEAEKTVIGLTWGGWPYGARDTRIDGHIGPIAYGKQSGTTKSKDAGRKATATRLTRARVGPGAA